LESTNRIILLKEPLRLSDLDMTDIEKDFEKKYAHKSIDCEKIRGNRVKLCMEKNCQSWFFTIFFMIIFYSYSVDKESL
jgi:hypothetical protein